VFLDLSNGRYSQAKSTDKESARGHPPPPSDPAAVNSICTLHAPKYIPKVIGAYIHAFLTFGFQKGDFAGFL